MTPRLGFVFKPKENISFYASYSQTFLPKSGEQYASVGTNDINLDPDEFINLEFGVKWDFNPRMSFTAAIFDLQRDASQSDGMGGSVDVESEVQGFETQIQGQISDAWFITAGYGYLEGETSTGTRPRELPEHTFSVWNQYRLSEKFGVGLGAIYQDETFIKDSNNTELPSYFRVDAAAYYQLSDNLRVQLNVENLLNEAYYPNAHGDHQVTVGAPINARIALTGRF